MRSDLTVAIAPPTSRINFIGTISNNLCACGITKLGPGRMDMRAVNTYLGRTTVERGVLLLEGAPSPSVRGGSLAIAPPPTLDNTTVAQVIVNSPNQIADDTAVEVKRGGALVVNDQETVGATTVTDGRITVTSTPMVPAGLAMTGLTMTGGSIESYDGGQLHLLGTVTAMSNGGGSAASIKRFSGNGAINLGQGSRTFDISTGGSGVAALVISIPIVAPGATSLIKQGNGRLLLEGANTYTGETHVVQGELLASGSERRGHAQWTRARRRRRQPRGPHARVGPEHPR